ncbi:MAG TPA: hypothetical protein ENJ29_10515, partial [Bacteroidetes bacterium]|nr:hypothetical protein [Bacteroidota bacterium]
MKTRLILSLLMPALMACGQAQKEPAPMLNTRAVDALITSLQDSLQAEIGLAFYDLETGQEFTRNARTMMHAASTMKVPVMIELFRQADAGTLSLDDSIRIRN